MSDIQEKVNELTKKISGEMDAHLFESIVSLFHQGVLKHYVRSTRCNYDPSNFKMSVNAASGVRFEGREKIIELEKELATERQQNKELIEALEFYADKKNIHGTKSSIVYEIDCDRTAYCINFGERARQALEKIKGKDDE